MIGTILLFLVVLSLLVFVHEAGHFFMARKMGMKVEEFGFGFPPRLFGWKKGDTVYSLNWIPLGGFVKIKGESGDNKGDADSFASKKAWQRLVVLVAGVAMNLVLAAILLSIGFMIGLPSVVDDATPMAAQVRERAVTIMSVAPESPAARAGIEAGDTLIAVDGQAIASAEAARAAISASGNDGVEVTVKHGEKGEAVLTLVSEEIPSANVRGVGVGLLDTGIVSFGPLQAMYHGVLATGMFTWEVIKAFGGLLKNLIVSQTVSVDLSGPVGIAVMTGEAASLGIVSLMQFAALLSINLAVLNVLPFPALDGGRALFVIIEKLRGRSVDQRLETAVHNLGFLMLMGLVVLVTYRDFVKFGGQIWGTMRSLIGA